MKILLGDFNAKVGRENISKLTIGNESLHQDSNGNGVRIVNFSTSKTLVVKSTCSRTETFISFERKSEGKRTLEYPRHKWEDNIKRNLQEVV